MCVTQSRGQEVIAVLYFGHKMESISGVEWEHAPRTGKLTSNNYHTWKFQIRLLLGSKDLYRIVTRDEVLEVTATEEEKTKFRKREQTAFSIIGLSVHASLHIYIRRSVKMSKEAWDILAKHFKSSFN